MITNPIVQIYLKIKVVTPDSNYRIFWDFMILFFLCLNVWYIPLKISFSLKLNIFEQTIYYYFLEFIPVTIFLIDIIVILNTSYYSKGAFITKKSKIASNYYKKYFFLDVITLGPALISTQLSIGSAEILFLLRIIKMRNLVKKIDEYLDLPEKMQGFYELIKLMFFVVYIAHFCGCTYYYVGELGIDYINLDSSWINKYK